MTHRALHPMIRAAAFLPALALTACVPLPANYGGGKHERVSPPRNCIGLLVEATTALTSTAGDTSVANVMTAHATHGMKMAEYHSCLAEDP